MHIYAFALSSMARTRLLNTRDGKIISAFIDFLNSALCFYFLFLLNHFQEDKDNVISCNNAICIVIVGR